MKLHGGRGQSSVLICASVSADGSVALISSNTDWKTSSGPLVFNSIYTAEHYDARLEQPGWNMAGFEDSGWADAIPVSAPSQNIVAQVMHPIRITAEIDPISAKQVGPLTWVFDLGRNIAGISSLEVSGPQGAVVRMKHAERLNEKALLTSQTLMYIIVPRMTRILSRQIS